MPQTTELRKVTRKELVAMLETLTNAYSSFISSEFDGKQTQNCGEQEPIVKDARALLARTKI